VLPVDINVLAPLTYQILLRSKVKNTDRKNDGSWSLQFCMRDFLCPAWKVIITVKATRCVGWLSTMQGVFSLMVAKRKRWSQWWGADQHFSQPDRAVPAPTCTTQPWQHLLLGCPV